MEFWKRFQIWCLKWLLASHKPYSTISSAGPEDGGEYDTYWIRLVKYTDQKEQHQQFNAQELGELDTSPEVKYRLNVVLGDDKKVKYQEFKRESKGPDKPLIDLKPAFFAKHHIEIHHFYRDMEVKSSSPVWTALKRRLGFHWVQFWLMKAHIWLRSRRFTVVDDYISVLEALLKAGRANNGAVSSLEVCRFLYGKKLKAIDTAILLDANDRCKGVLDYLAVVGDVHKAGYEYRPNAKTLHAISERERQRLSERREISVQRNQLLLTFILAASSLALAVFEGIRLFWLQI